MPMAERLVSGTAGISSSSGPLGRGYRVFATLPIFL